MVGYADDKILVSVIKDLEDTELYSCEAISAGFMIAKGKIEAVLITK